MSRRKQAKPRSLKRDEEEDDTEQDVVVHTEADDDFRQANPPRTPGSIQGDSRGSPLPPAIQNSPLQHEWQAASAERGTEEDPGEDPASPLILPNEEALGSEPGSTSSWRSDSSSSSTLEEAPVEGPSAVAATKAAVPAGRASSASSSCSSSASSQPPDGELGFTLGVTETTPYPCQFCAKAFPRLSYLKKHEQSHAEHMPFRCEFCSRLFKHKRSRDRHVKLHTGDRKYRCNQCEAAFSRSDHLKIHMKTHDTQKPFQCSACNRGYNTAAALTSHSQTHKRPPSLPASLPPRNSPRHSPPSAPPRRVTPAPSPVAPAFPRNLTPNPHTHELLRAAHPAAAAAAAVLFNRELQQVLQHEASSPPGSARSAFNAAAMAAAALAHSAGLQFATPTLACIYCTKDGFTSMEQLQLHVQAMHGSILNGEREYQPPSPGHHQGSARQPPVSPSQPYNCDFCTMKFDHVQSLHKHTMAVHAMSPTTPFGATADSAEQLKPTDLSINGKSNGKTPPLSAPPPPRNDTLAQSTFLCSQCNAPCPDFESFRSHLRSHLDAEHGKGSPPRVAAKTVAPPPPPAPQLQCPECPESFTNENSLEVHCLGHFLATSTEFSCQSCLKAFPRPDELQKHLMDAHAHQLLRCALCRELFDTRVAAQVHFAVKHSSESRVLRCVACGDASAKFRSEIEFGLHVKIHHLAMMEKLRCLYCSELFKSDAELQYHVASYHQKMYRCKFCDEAFHVEFQLDKHLEHKHKDKSPAAAPQGKPQIKSPGAVSLVCAYCQESCKSRADLEAHMKTHHQRSNGAAAPSNGVALGRHKCNICDMVCVSPALLAEHKLATHCKVLHGDTCSVCKASLGTEEHFMSHMHKHCPGSAGTADIGLPTACVICRQTVTSEHEVQLHARFHLQQKQNHALQPGKGVSCGECAGRFDSGADLEAHAAKLHSRKFECISCQLSFHTESEVRAHVEAAHAPDNGQRCRLCQEVFDTPLKLQVHLIEHTFVGCPTFACYLCGAVFTAAAGLQRHMGSHGAGSKPYDCTKCHLRFFFRAELENHAFVHVGEKQLKEELHVDADAADDNAAADEQSEALSLAMRKRKTAEINGNDISSAATLEPAELELKKLKLEVPDEQTQQAVA
ncbi:zinc finger protein 423 isoform X2 [Cloeon dipterum]|uniref:zinc finger protein 423 isoform X2 n=1 Tax=Cloeon dipterum TaxID=197152 RepID=UPI0032209891